MSLKRKLIKTIGRDHIIFKKIIKHYLDTKSEFHKIYDELYINVFIIIDKNVSVVKLVFSDGITFKYFDEDKYSCLLVDDFDEWKTESDIPQILIQIFDCMMNKIFTTVYVTGMYYNSYGLHEIMEYYFWRKDMNMRKKLNIIGILR